MVKAHWLSSTQKTPFEIRGLTADSYLVDLEFHLFLDDLLQVLFPFWCFTRCYHFYTERLRKQRAKCRIQHDVWRGKGPFGRRQKIEPGRVPRARQQLHMWRVGCAARHDTGWCLSLWGLSGHCCGTWGAATGHEICIWCWSQRCGDGCCAERQSHLPVRACMKLAGHTLTIKHPSSSQQQLTGWHLYNCTGRRWQVSNNGTWHS